MRQEDTVGGLPNTIREQLLACLRSQSHGDLSCYPSGYNPQWTRWSINGRPFWTVTYGDNSFQIYDDGEIRYFEWHSYLEVW